jgi:hypothetical protein
MQLLARQLARKFSKCQVRGIERDDLRSVTQDIAAPARGDAAIIVDDAFETGDTVLRIIDLVERLSFSFIMVFPLIRRGSEDFGRRLTKISRYGMANLHFRFLAEATIPTYPAHGCPACRNLEEWSLLAEKLGQCRLIRYLVKRQTERLLPKSVSAISHEQLLLPLGESDNDHAMLGDLRWRLEIARIVPSERDFFLEIYGERRPIPRMRVLLLKVLSHDRFIEGLSEQERTSIFSAELRQRIVKYAATLVGQLDKAGRDLEEIDAALCLLLNLDPDAFHIQLREALTKAFGESVEALAWIIGFTVRKEHKIQFATRVLGDLALLDKLCTENDERRELIDGALALWRARQDEINNLRADRVAVYRELVGGRLHEISHLKEELIGRTQELTVDIEAIERSWDALEQEMRERILPLLRSFGRNEMSNNVLRARFYDTVDALRFQLEEGRNVVDELVRSKTALPRSSQDEMTSILASRLGARSRCNSC